jgi:hypothetical protein
MLKSLLILGAIIVLPMFFFNGCSVAESEPTLTQETVKALVRSYMRTDEFLRDIEPYYDRFKYDEKGRIILRRLCCSKTDEAKITVVYGGNGLWTIDVNVLLDLDEDDDPYLYNSRLTNRYLLNFHIIDSTQKVIFIRSLKFSSR